MFVLSTRVPCENNYIDLQQVNICMNSRWAVKLLQCVVCTRQVAVRQSPVSSSQAGDWCRHPPSTRESPDRRGPDWQRAEDLCLNLNSLINFCPKQKLNRLENISCLLLCWLECCQLVNHLNSKLFIFTGGKFHRVHYLLFMLERGERLHLAVEQARNASQSAKSLRDSLIILEMVWLYTAQSFTSTDGQARLCEEYL